MRHCGSHELSTPRSVYDGVPVCCTAFRRGLAWSGRGCVPPSLSEPRGPLPSNPRPRVEENLQHGKEGAVESRFPLVRLSQFNLPARSCRPSPEKEGLTRFPAPAGAHKATGSSRNARFCCAADSGKSRRWLGLSASRLAVMHVGCRSSVDGLCSPGLHGRHGLDPRRPVAYHGDPFVGTFVMAIPWMHQVPSVGQGKRKERRRRGGGAHGKRRGGAGDEGREENTPVRRVQQLALRIAKARDVGPLPLAAPSASSLPVVSFFISGLFCPRRAPYLV